MEIKYRKIAELKPAEYNPRQLSKKQFEDLKKSFENLGTLEPAVINSHPGREDVIISGHQRLKVAEALGMTEYPCFEVSFPEAKEREANIRMNANTGSWDFDLLANNFEVDELKEWGLDLSELNFDPAIDGLTDADAIPETPAEPKTKPGDLYKLGEHRLLCGDSTNPQHIERLMGDVIADMVFTDPPYGIDYEGKTKDKLKIKNDLDCLAFSDAISIIPLKPGGAMYVCCPGGNKHAEFELVFQKYCHHSCTIIWNKDSMVLCHGDYHYKHEPILYGWRLGGTHSFHGNRSQTTVWDIARPKASKLHPTMKPVELIERAINNSSMQNNIIFDCFGGSGSTLIACEKTFRKCRIMEIDPIYCDVIIKRWEDFTGKKAEII